MSSEAAIRGHQDPLLSIKRFLFPLLARPRVKQALKWFVYGALLINSAYYFYIDYGSWLAALPADASILDILTQVATSIDTVAWVLLVVFFELETYALPDRFWKDWVLRLVHLLRVFCYVMIAFSAWGYTVETLNNYRFSEAADISTACDAADTGVSMQTDANTWTEISSANCGSVDDDTFYRLDGEVALIPASALPEIQFLGWFDVINAYFWIIVVLLIEVEVRMQNSDRFGGPLMAAVRTTKTLLYLVLIGHCVLWLVTGYYVWSWDAFLWIFGFWAIELNLAEWELDRTRELEAVAAAARA